MSMNVDASGRCSVADESCRQCPACYLDFGVGTYSPACSECSGTGCATEAHRFPQED